MVQIDKRLRACEVVFEDGLVLLSRFFHLDLDLESFAVVPGLGLSHPTDSRLQRTWVALLRGPVQASLTASTGVDPPRRPRQV